LQPVKPNHKWISSQNMDGFPIPNGESYNWDFLPGVTLVVDKGIFSTINKFII
jgi:hypothetical protein